MTESYTNTDAFLPSMITLPETTEDIVVRLIRLASTKLPADIGWADRKSVV